MKLSIFNIFLMLISVHTFQHTGYDVHTYTTNNERHQSDYMYIHNFDDIDKSREITNVSSSSGPRKGPDTAGWAVDCLPICKYSYCFIM